MRSPSSRTSRWATTMTTSNGDHAIPDIRSEVPGAIAAEAARAGGTSTLEDLARQGEQLVDRIARSLFATLPGDSAPPRIPGMSVAGGVPTPGELAFGSGDLHGALPPLLGEPRELQPIPEPGARGYYFLSPPVAATAI